MIIPDNMLVHIQKIFAGEYEIAFNSPNPIIFDVGANIGGFTRWRMRDGRIAKLFALNQLNQILKCFKKIHLI